MTNFAELVFVTSVEESNCSGRDSPLGWHGWIVGEKDAGAHACSILAAFVAAVVGVDASAG